MLVRIDTAGTHAYSSGSVCLLPDDSRLSGGLIYVDVVALGL